MENQPIRRGCPLLWVSLLLGIYLVFIGTERVLAESTVEAREVGGHSFLPSRLLDQPFNTCHYSMSAGLNLAEVDLANGTDLDVVDFGFNVGTQQPIWQGLGARLDLTGDVLSGTDEQSALFFGTQGQWQIGGGLYYNLIDHEHFVLTPAFDIAVGKLYALTPLGPFSSVITTGNFDTTTLFNEVNILELHPSVAAAMPIGDSLGVYAEVDYRRQSLSREERPNTDADFVDLGIGVSLHSDLPIGFLAAYQRQQELGGAELVVNNIEATLFYTPTEHFVFGGSAVIQLADSENDFELFNLGGFLTMTYYQ